MYLALRMINYGSTKSKTLRSWLLIMCYDLLPKGYYTIVIGFEQIIHSQD